jgi:hypothetical protein
MVLRSVYFMVKIRIFIPELWDFIHQIERDFKAIFRMSRCKLRTPLPIHFKLRIVIGIDSLMVCIGMKIRIFTIKYTDRKTINSNNSVKFEVNWPRGS